MIPLLLIIIVVIVLVEFKLHFGHTGKVYRTIQKQRKVQSSTKQSDNQNKNSLHK